MLLPSEAPQIVSGGGHSGKALGCRSHWVEDLFLAWGGEPSANGPAHDDIEAITEIRAFTLGELRAMIAENVIRDANTLSAYARMVAIGLIDR